MMKKLLVNTQEMILFQNKNARDNKIKRTTQSHFDPRLQLRVKNKELLSELHLEIVHKIL